jgi:hypothetical protein
MAKKKGKPVQPTYQDRHTSPRVVFHLPDDLLALIDQQAAAADRTRTAEIIRAIRSYYQAQGLWPLPQQEGGGA